MTDTPDPVARINALTTNARNTWFVLLGVLVFVAITLMGVQHIDFYGVDRATALPLVNVSVPTWLFFYAAPLLITAVYGYFHLYLIRLWDALGDADPIINGTPLGDAITPWLVSDVALKLRATYRDPTCITPRAMEVPNAIWNTLFAWIAGPAILGWLWWASMPARDWIMTGLAGIFLILALAFGYASFSMMQRRMASDKESRVHNVWNDSALVVLAVFALAIGSVTTGRTRGDIDTLAQINLTGAALVEKPADWLPYDIARADFLAEWCAREKPACDPPKAAVPGLIRRLPGLLFGKDDTPALPTPASDPPAAFETEWKTRRTAALAALKKPRWSAPNADPPDFRNAILSETFLSGADLGGAQMQGARLSASINNGGALRFVDLHPAKIDALTDWRNSFFDGSVLVPNDRKTHIGQPCLWGWIAKNPDPLPDKEYFGRWRGWLTLDPEWDDGNWSWFLSVPEDWRDVATIPPPPGCIWHSDPLPGAVSQE